MSMMIVSGVQSHSGAKFCKRTKPEKVQSGTFLFCSMQSRCLEISKEYLVTISPIRCRNTHIHHLLFNIYFLLFTIFYLPNMFYSILCCRFFFRLTWLVVAWRGLFNFGSPACKDNKWDQYGARQTSIHHGKYHNTPTRNGNKQKNTNTDANKNNTNTNRIRQTTIHHDGNTQNIDVN